MTGIALGAIVRRRGSKINGEVVGFNFATDEAMVAFDDGDTFYLGYDDLQEVMK